MKPVKLNKTKKPYTDIHTREALEALMSESGGAGVIDFWAPWCAPCRAVAPHFEAVAAHYRDEPVQFYKINTESQPALAATFHIQSIPTMVFVNRGEILDVNVGALDATRLADKVEWLLSKARGEGFWTRFFGMRRASRKATAPAG
jgi:thioredoxin